MSRRRPPELPAPYLRRILIEPDKVADWSDYPFSLPLFATREFELPFESAVTIIVGENGSGKSTLLEGIAALAGFDEAGGGNGYRAVDHSNALDRSGAGLAGVLRAHWLPKITRGWFFRAESFFSVARYLDSVGASADFLSYSHGEGFLRFFEERVRQRGFFIFDEPESALSPSRQIIFLKMLRRMERDFACQIIMATHSPVLMAYPGATLLRIDGGELQPTLVHETEHFRLLKAFFDAPEAFVEEALVG
jgi:predicted ATPase